MSPRYWDSPETVGLNRLPMLNIEQFEKISLDGTWRFQLLETPTESPRKRWAEIEVPGLWTDAAIGSADLDFAAPTVPDINPTGIYERSFEIPGSWSNKRVVLHIGGVESVASIYLNNELVGIAKDSRLASEFQINAYLRAGKNVLRIHVTQWSDSSHLEDIDHHWHGGISRSIKLYATSEVFIEQLTSVANFNTRNSTGSITIDATIGVIHGKSSLGYSLKASVEELPKSKGALVTEKIEDDGVTSPRKINLQLNVGKVLPWSSESPELYTIHYELIDPLGNIVQISSQRVGFREFELTSDCLFVNGAEVNLYGFSTQFDTPPVNRTASRDEIRQLLLELKRRHVTALRSSYFAADPAFLDLCDELGFYVLAEANIYPGEAYQVISSHPQYLAPILDRASRMVQRDISHPSVFAWSLGTDQAYGINIEVAAQYVELFDISRTVVDLDAIPAPEFEIPEPPIVVTATNLAAGAFTVFNNQVFEDSSEYILGWRIEEDGNVIDSAAIKLPILAPQKTSRVQVKSNEIKTGKKSHRKIVFSIVRKSSTAWSSALSEIAAFEFEFGAKRKKL